MSQYRDQLDAARARIETLEAKLSERDASLAARDAELAETRAEVARLQRGEGGGQDDDRPLEGPDLRGAQRALVAALAVCGFATATGYAVLRPSHCHQRSAFSATRPTHGHSSAAFETMDLGATVSSAANGPAQRAARVRLGKAVAVALEEAKQRVDVCKQDGPGDPSGPGSATVIFHSYGGVEVDLAPPYAGTDVGECVAQIYRTAQVLPFDGQPISATARFGL